MICAHEWNRKITSSFSKAAASYDHAAYIQKKASMLLSEQIEQNVSTPTSIVEFGAGTGFLTRRLLSQFPKAMLTAVDLSFPMLQALFQNLTDEEKRRVFFAIADMDTMEPTDHSLLCSSFALHWSKDPLHLLKKSHLFVKSGGFVAHCLPLRGSLRSLAEGGFIQPPYKLSLSLEQVLQALTSFDILSATVEEIHQSFPSPLSALKSLKAFGGAVSFSPIRNLFYLRRLNKEISCEWRIGCVIARRKV